jgi:hypothetical protein
MAAEIRMTRPQLERVFGDDYDALNQMEILIDQINLFNNLQVGEPSAPEWPGGAFDGPLQINYGIEGGPGLEINASETDGDFINLNNNDGNLVMYFRSDASENGELKVQSNTNVNYLTVDSTGVTTALTINGVPLTSSGTGDLFLTDAGTYVSFSENVDDQVASLIQDGVGLTWTYDDTAGTLTGDVSLSVFTTDDLAEGVVNLYYTEERVDANRKDNILEYGYEEVTVSTTISKTKTNFSGSIAGQTLTLPTVGTSGREVEVFNTSSVTVSLSGSSVLSELYPNESACFTDLGSDWVA